MNKKLRVLFCMLFAAIAVFALALVACDDDNSNASTGSESSSTTDDTGSSTGAETDPGTETPETDDTITVTLTTAYDSDYSWYYATSTYTATASGSYTVAITSPESTTAYVYVYVNGSYTAFAYQTDTDNVTVATGDVLTFYLYDSYAEAVGEYTVTLTEYEVTATIPTALTIPGDTVASLDSTGYEYDLYYTVTDDTAGEYTFTLSGDTLTDVTVYIYNGYVQVAELSSTNTTATALFASGDELNVTASVPSTTTTAIAFTLKTEIDTTAETRTGYTADNPVNIYSYTGYDYDKDFTVTTDNSLYFKITASYYSSVDLILTVTSTDSTFKVYGYCSGDAVTEYAELTLTEGSYSLSLATRATEYIMIVPSVAGTINVKLAEQEEVVEPITYIALSLDTETTLSASAYYTFTAETDGTYVFAVGSTSDVYISDVDYFVDSTAYSVNTWDIYYGAKEEIELEAGDKLYISCYNVYYDNSTLTIYLQKSLSYSATLDSDTTSAETTLTITDAGYYAVSVTGAESSYYVYLYDAQYNYYYNTSNTYCGYIIDYSENDEVPISVAAGTVLNLVIGYYGSDTVTITATITLDPLYSSSSSSPSTYTELSITDENTISNSDIYQLTATADGTYTFELVDDGDICIVDDLVSYYPDIDEEIWDAGSSVKIKVTTGDILYVYNNTNYVTSSTFTVTFKESTPAKDGYYNVSALDTTYDDSYSVIISDVSDSYITLSATGVVSETEGTYDGTLDEYVNLDARILLYTSSYSGAKTLTLSVTTSATVTIYYAATTDITVSYGDDGSTTLAATGSTTTVVAYELTLTAGVSYTFTCAGTSASSGAAIYAIVVPTTAE